MWSLCGLCLIEKDNIQHFLKEGRLKFWNCNMNKHFGFHFQKLVPYILISNKVLYAFTYMYICIHHYPVQYRQVLLWVTVKTNSSFWRMIALENKFLFILEPCCIFLIILFSYLLRKEPLFSNKKAVRSLAVHFDKTFNYY